MVVTAHINEQTDHGNDEDEDEDEKMMLDLILILILTIVLLLALEAWPGELRLRGLPPWLPGRPGVRRRVRAACKQSRTLESYSLPVTLR